jgi:hypothetical protein
VKRRRVFVDATFVRALLDDDVEKFNEARTVFASLLDEYERGETVLYSHAGMVAAVGGDRTDDLFRVCEVEPVRRQLRRRAWRLVNRISGLDENQAIALLMLRREAIGEIATLDPLYAEMGVPTVC